MIWRIYKYTNIITGQSYIGQTTRNVNVRAGNGTNYHKGTPFREAIDKYGFDNFEQSILRLCTSQEEADQYEQLFIDKYNTLYPNGYNLQSGGKKDAQLHELTKKKISENHYDFSGENHPCYGIHHTEEHNNKISLSMKSYVKSTEHRKNLSISLKGNTNTKGKKWFNNGVKNTRAFECPEGFLPGRMTKITQS